MVMTIFPYWVDEAEWHSLFEEGQLDDRLVRALEKSILTTFACRFFKDSQSTSLVMRVSTPGGNDSDFSSQGAESGSNSETRPHKRCSLGSFHMRPLIGADVSAC